MSALPHVVPRCRTRAGRRHRGGRRRGLPFNARRAPAAAADTWAVVDGHEIKRDDVDKAFRRSRDASAPLSDEETLLAKLNLLDEMILQQILLAKAAALKIEVPQSELDTADADARKNIPPDTFQQELVQRGLTAADMRESLRRELLAQKVIKQEVDDKIAVTDKDVTDFFNANRAQFNVPEESYHLAQIVITPARDAQITNGTGDDAASPAGGRGQGADADGAPEGRGVVRRPRARLLGGCGDGAARRRSRASCRCRGCSRRRRSCATPCWARTRVR